MAEAARAAAVRIKICGLTRAADALAAARLGAHALGFNFWPRSRRYLPPAEAGAIVRALPAGILAVGVFVNPTRAELLEAIAASGVGMVQLHGDEPPERCAGLPVPVLKAIRVADARSLDALPAYAAAGLAGFLLDAPSPGYGGSGAGFDWALAAPAAAAHPVWLAGGLHPGNVAAAIRAVRPCAVDVASGVEAAPGLKDEEKMASFIRAVQEAM
jgi:phosphoribosylanthranilate isomerase